MNNRQLQVVGKILLLIAASGKGRLSSPLEKPVEYQPGITLADFQVVTTADLKKAQPVLSKIHFDLRKIFQQAPPSKLFSPEDRKIFFTESQAFLGQHIGPWSKDLPEWWFQVYSIGLHIKTQASDFKKFTLYPSKILFNALVKTLSSLGQGTTLLSPVQLDANLQMPLLHVLLEAAVPPSLLAELIVLETDIDFQKKCIEMVIYFIRKQTLKFLGPLYEYQALCFTDPSLWIDVFGAVTSMYSCYFQTDTVDIFAEKKVSVALGMLANELLTAMATSDKAKTIQALLAIKAYYQGLPERLQSMKLYLGPMALYREFYMPLYTSTENGLKPDFKWYLAHLVPSYPTKHDVGFVVGRGVLQYAHKQLEQENFELVLQTLSSLPECTQPLAYFDLLRTVLSSPQKLIAFAKYYREQNNIPLLKSLYLKLASVAKVQEAVAGWIGTDFNQGGALSLDIFEGFLDVDDKMEVLQLQAFLLKGFAYFQFHQAAGILWFTWLKSCIGDKALLTASKQLGNAEAEKWFSQRFIFQENPGQAGLVDEALAVNLFFSAEFMLLVMQGDSKKVGPLIKSLKPSLPKISKRVALHMITFCPTFSMAKVVVGELLETQTDEMLCIRILLHALYTNQPNILKTYRDMTDKETLYRHLTSLKFLDEFGDILYFMADYILDTKTYQLSESFKVLSEMLTEALSGFDKSLEDISIFQQHLMHSVSLKSKLLESIMESFFYLIKGKLNLLPKDEQKQFEQRGSKPTVKQLTHYLHLAHQLINLEEQDFSLSETVAYGIYHTWMNVDRSDRSQVRRFLLMLVDLINCIHGLVPKATSPVIKPVTEEEATRNNYVSLSSLIKCLFYQIHARGFDDDVSIIGRLQNQRLRRDFVSAHIVRLVLCENMDAVKKMQKCFKTQINYSVKMNLLFELEDNNNPKGNNKERVVYYQSRRIFPLMITTGNSLEFPIKQIDCLSINLEVISEIGDFLNENTRKLLSRTLKNQIDNCSELSAATQPVPLFRINHPLINELILKADLDCIQLAFESFDCDQNLEIAREAIKTAASRFSLTKETETAKQTALKIAKLLLNIMGHDWKHLVSQKILDTKNENMISIITLIKLMDLEFFGSLYNYFVVEVSKSEEEVPATKEPELIQTPERSITVVDFEKAVETSYLKNKSATTTISLARMKSIVEKANLGSEGDIDKFIRGYLADADHATAPKVGFHSKSMDSVPLVTTLLNASYFKGTRFVQDRQHFYSVRKSQTESYLYFNPIEIEELANPAPFQLLCEKLRFVSRSGAGLKYLSNLRIQVQGIEIEGGYEMKIHGSKERILCYLAPSDHPDNPNVYVACLYLEDGLHGRVDPNKPFIIPNKPSFGVSINVETPVANFHR